MVDPTIGNKISKSGPNSITEETENVTYTITYESNATDYIGKAQVKLVDQLPFEIDPGLNEHKYIVPGFGDAGDLCYGGKI